MMTAAATGRSEMEWVLPALPTDALRQIMWRFSDRQELQELVLATRSVARGVVARLVAEGERNSCQWTESKSRMLAAFDAAGISSLVVGAEHGGRIAGSRTLARALAAFELAWVDGGAAACSIALGFALAPLAEQATPPQRQEYLERCVARSSAPSSAVQHGAFCLTEPLPYAGVDTGVLSGKVRIAEWEEGREPILLVEKRGRLIGNMDFANFVLATVASDDPRIQGTCMILLEEGDEGTFDRGAVSCKLGHQLSSTRDPVFRLRVPASRILGGYSIQNGAIVPEHHHRAIVQPVLARARVSLALATAAKLLSAIEPVIRYQRERFCGSEAPDDVARRELGLQTQQDAVQRLIDVWAAGEAAASLGFAAARQFDACDQLARSADGALASLAASGRGAGREMRQGAARRALEYLRLAAERGGEGDEARLEELAADPLVDYLLKESVADVLSPAAKLWSTGHCADVLREALSLMGACSVTPECPGFLPYKWMDAQVEAMYEGPPSVHRRQLVAAMTHELFLAQFQNWIGDMRRIAARRPGAGACTVASAMDLWLWTLRHLQDARDADGLPVFRERRQGATFPMADALCWLLASRCQILDVMELEEQGPKSAVAEQLPGYLQFFTDLAHVQAAQAAGEVGRTCAELVYGYQRHPSWDAACGSCLPGDAVDALEAVIPGIALGARIAGDVVESGGEHDAKAGPCVRFAGLYEFMRRRSKLDGCLTGARLAKDRAARSLTQVPIPDSLDYPR